MSSTLQPLSIRSIKVESIMTASPITVKTYQTVQEAMVLMLDHRIAALPVVDGLGLAVGVISQTDVVRYQREKMDVSSPTATFYDAVNLELPSGEVLGSGFEMENADLTKVSEIMTPMVLSIRPDADVKNAIKEMLSHRVHRLFVQDDKGQLVGVISTFDVLRQIVV